MSPGLTEFALAMIAANLAFVSGAWLRGLVDRAESAGARGSLRRRLPAVPGFDGPDHGGRS